MPTKNVSHIREIFTDTGCGGECAISFFTIAYNVDGTYRQYIVKEGEELLKEMIMNTLIKKTI